MRRPAHRVPVLGLAGLLAWRLVACGPDRPSDLPVDSLPEYSADTAGPFDDSIASVVFTDDSTRQGGRPLEEVAKMAGLSDYVISARLKALSKNRTKDRVTYVLLVETGQALRGAAPDPSFELTAGPAATSLLRTVGGVGVGKKFIVFLKRYRATDEPAWHFRIEPDTEAVRAAVNQAD